MKYEQEGERVTHFRPFMDFFRISVLNTILCTIAFAYIKPRDFIKQLSWKNLKAILHGIIFMIIIKKLTLIKNTLTEFLS